VVKRFSFSGDNNKEDTLMRNVGLLMLILFLSLSFSFLKAEERWIPLMEPSPSETKVNVLKSDLTGLNLEVKIGGFISSDVLTNAGEFVRFSLPNYGYTPKIGEPQFPVIREFIEVPFGADFEIQVKKSTFWEFSLQELGIRNRIIPVQMPIPKISGALEEAEFVLDESVYAQNFFSPTQIVKVREAGILRGHRLALIEIFPLIYNPREGRVRLYSEIEFRVNLKGSNLAQTLDQLRRYRSLPFEQLVQSLVLNYGDLEELAPPPIPIGYLIITHDNFYNNILPLANWKNKKGFLTTVTKLSEINPQTNTGIRNYILNAYNNWDVPPTFVLLVGDVGYIPTWHGSTTGSASDLNYTTMTPNDYFPDLGIGRFPTNSTGQVDVMVTKVLENEKWEITPTDWVKKAAFIASCDNWQVSEETHNYVISHYMDPAGYTSYKHYCRLGTADRADITNSINAGRSLVIDSGHGDITYWADPVYYQSDVRSLTNVDMYPFVCSHACLTGDFEYGECFGETWLREANKGGIAFWGASSYTYWDEDDILEKKMFKACYTDTLTWLTGMTDKAKYYLWQYYGGGGLSKYYYEVYNLLGEPSWDLWTAIPANLVVTHPSSVPLGTSEFTVTVKNSSGTPLSNALVCLYKDTEVYLTGYTNTSGQIIFTVTVSTLGILYVTVTKHNYKPYEGSADVGAPDVTLTLTPDATTVPRGGTLGYTGTVTNNTAYTVNFEYWAEVILPNGNPYGGNPVVGPRSVTLNPNQTKSGHISHDVPLNAPLGTYTYIGKIGFYPSSVWDEDSFQFIVTTKKEGGGKKDKIGAKFN